ncbi:MAG: DUF3990 domain-containing protein [Candidatus Symbiothrix sp.]|jgi:hypothetical protein|nr:DUF3990 domain-containing protein [Candidatus Symbiothrix sp.]
MQVYHGSYTEIDDIDLKKCISYKDFGKGFYVTKYRHHAENWAKIIGLRHHTKGVVTEFDFTEGSFTESICKVKRFDDYNEEWLDFVVMNRNKKLPEPAHDYDIVEGPVADDKIQNRIDLYLAGEISKEDFLKDLTYHEATHQICFCTVVSLQTIDRTSRSAMLKIVRIGELLVEAMVLDNQELNEKTATDLFYGSNTFTQLANTSTQLYLKPWQEIYEMLKLELGTK